MIKKKKGTVIRLAQGTLDGGEVEFIALQTKKKKKLFVLKRLDWPGPDDPELIKLLGKEVEFEGVKQGQTLIVTSWRISK